MTKAQILTISTLRARHGGEGKTNVTEIPDREVIFNIESNERSELYIIAFDGRIIEGNIREFLAAPQKLTLSDHVTALEKFYILSKIPYEVKLAPNCDGVMVVTEKLTSIFYSDETISKIRHD